MSTAVLISGGLDSAVLLAEECARPGSGLVHPIYVSGGLAWEAAERSVVAALLTAAPFAERVRPLVPLSVEMRDVYAPGHWAIDGRPPDYHTADEDVYLPGRNIVLLGKAAIYCATAGVDRLVLGTLGHNPFPDATPAFRAAMAAALSLGLAHPLIIDAPFATATKADIIARGVGLGVPLELTLSCMNPRIEAVPAPAGLQRTGGAPRFVHCGTCSKCRERHDAFIEAGVVDPTTYADRRYVGA